MADSRKYPTRLAPYGLRIPPALKEFIQEEADLHGRSLHSEILMALQKYYDWHDEDRPNTVGDMLAKHEESGEPVAALDRQSEGIGDALKGVPDVGKMPIGQVLRKLRAADDIESFANLLADKLAQRLKP